MSDNVTRIHPSPSIPNPFTTNPYAVMTDAELDAELLRTEVRLDAVRHTLDSLTRERARRDDERDADCPECGDIGCRCGIDWTALGSGGSE